MAKKPRPQRTLEELRSASDHVAYEWDMLTAAVQGVARVLKIYQQLQVSPASTTLTDLAIFLIPATSTALVESAALHLRALTHFAYPERGPCHPDDVLAEDFLPNWEDVRPAFPEALAPVSGRVGTEVAHISYRRLPLAASEMTWPIGEMVRALTLILQEFVKHVPPDRVSARWVARAPEGGPKQFEDLPMFFPRWPLPTAPKG
jgi:hypothetical protein